MEPLLVQSQRYSFHAECTKSTGKEGGVNRAANKSQVCPEDDLNFRIEPQIGHGVNRAKPKLSAPLRGSQTLGNQAILLKKSEARLPHRVAERFIFSFLEMSNEWGRDEPSSHSEMYSLPNDVLIKPGCQHITMLEPNEL